ncbi:MAG TPA: XrtA/PEP-CTERM system histidine kinase PrsK [Casimicrobiaceae bacterium]|nr:XrtA/PEP-CTERM system histidine kinase PrsK [Casimicrobiaceae bacterium]
MTGSAFSTAAVWSYGIAAAGWLLFTLRIAFGLGSSARGVLLVAVGVATSLWAIAGATFGYTGRPGALFSLNVADVLRYAAWFAFVLALLSGATAAAPAMPRWLYWVGALLMGLGVLLSEGAPFPSIVEPGDQRFEFAARLGLAIVGLIVVEQLYRRVHAQARYSIKPLVVALAAMFGYDLTMYADALLFGRIDSDIWLARGLANALLIPFVAIATARNTGWTVEMHLSRGAVFHSTALFVSGAFLLAVSGAGYIVRYFGGEWGRALQIELLFVAIVLIVLTVTSGRVRSRLKVFVSKHFFSYRYDYREEWLRFTRTLAMDSTVLTSEERAIKALADLVESPSGALWLAGERDMFEPTRRLNMPPVEASLPRQAPMTGFLERTGWVVDIAEARRFPARYAGLELPEWLATLQDAWIVVPLSASGELVGFVVLGQPRTPVELDWEVRDLLKAAARAAAGHLNELRVSEALLEARKFDAFNRMSAFVVHDLKNLVAQLSLMHKNAERHRDNPEFQRDMLTTVENVVSRMNALMLQLRIGATPVENPRPVDLGPIVERVCASKREAGRVTLSLASGVLALGHEDRLEHVIGHLVQNAIDATRDSGDVSVEVASDGGYATIQVSDTGVGMSAAFVRERLFKPFETTKQSGMGIGVYESSQYVGAIGGRMLVDSTPGSGTRVRVLLPLVDGTTAPHRTEKEAA